MVSIAQFSNPTPGSKNQQPDRDSDGIPDGWEDALGLDADNAQDAMQDPDGDGFTNLEEYSANTDPLDSADRLTAHVQRLNDNVILLTFPQKAGRFYTIERAAGDGSWNTMQVLQSEPVSRTQQENIAGFGGGVYRIRVSLLE